MKRSIKVLLIVIVLGAVAFGVTIAIGKNTGFHSSNSSVQHSKSYEAGVAWVRNDFPGFNQNYCASSVLIAANATNCTPSQNIVMCDSQASAVAMLNYNTQQWIDGCLSVPFKHWPQWLQNYVNNANSGG